MFLYISPSRYTVLRPKNYLDTLRLFFFFYVLKITELTADEIEEMFAVILFRIFYLLISFVRT